MIDSEAIQAVGQLASTVDVRVAANIAFEKVLLTVAIVMSILCAIVGSVWQKDEDAFGRVFNAGVGALTGAVIGVVTGLLPASIAYLYTIW